MIESLLRGHQGLNDPAVGAEQHYSRLLGLTSRAATVITIVIWHVTIQLQQESSWIWDKSEGKAS